MSLSSVKTRDYPRTDPKRGVNYIKPILATYTLSNEDKGWVLNVSAAVTITVPPLSVPIGSQVDILNTSAGTVTFVAGSGTTINSKAGNLKLATQYTAATLIKTGASTWFLVGDLSA